VLVLAARWLVSEDILISIVDDQASIREAVQALIQSYGYKVAIFSSAELFLRSEVVSETRCLIADLEMPGLNGLDLQNELKARGHQTPVIMITAYPDEKHRAEALDAGAVCFLTKPFDEKALIDCVTAAINGRK
jgi:FixJ family two-component response regulator